MKKPVFQLLGLGLLTAAIAVSAPIPTASAATSHFFDGGGAYSISSSHPTGAYATISSDNPYTTSTGFSCAWAMLANSNDSYIYAQMGWTKDAFRGQTSPYEFSAWNPDDGQGERIVYYSAVNGTTHRYGVIDVNRSGSYGGYIHFSVDSGYVGQVYWNNVFKNGPCDAVEYYGEIPSSSNQMPGTSSKHVTFSNVTYESWHPTDNTYGVGTPYLNAWANGDSTSMLDNSTYNASTSSGNFSIWDTASFSQ